MRTKKQKRVDSIVVTDFTINTSKDRQPENIRYTKKNSKHDSDNQHKDVYF